MASPLLIVTIFTANYLAHTRTLFEAVRKFHPEAVCLGLLVDRCDGRFDPRAETFDIVSVEDLELPHKRQLLFKYTPWERVMMFKPFALETGLRRYPHIEEVVYLDSDMFVTAPFEAARDILKRDVILVTPHLLTPVPDSRMLNELQFLRLGTFNMGFIALRRSAPAEQFLRWWREKLLWGCVSFPVHGFFVDQKWIDIVPSLFEGVHILRDPGYNVAVWNLLERPVERDGLPGRWRIGAAPLVCFHFSGYSLNTPNEISTPPPESMAAGELSAPVRELMGAYRERLLAHDYAGCSSWKNAFDFFDNGAPIPPLWPIYYRDVLQFRLDRDHDPYKGLPFSPVLALLKNFDCNPRLLRDKPYYHGWVSLLRRLGLAKTFLWGPPDSPTG